MLASSIALLAWRGPMRPAPLLVGAWFLSVVGTLVTGLAPNGISAGAVQIHSRLPWRNSLWLGSRLCQDWQTLD